MTRALPDLGDGRGGLAGPADNLPGGADEAFRTEEIFGDEGGDVGEEGVWEGGDDADWFDDNQFDAFEEVCGAYL